MPISSSVSAYRRSAGKPPCQRRASRPPAHDPSPKPAMNMESTVETMAVVTPKSAIASRSQINSYRMLQKPEMKKNTNSHAIVVHQPQKIPTFYPVSGRSNLSRDFHFEFPSGLDKRLPLFTAQELKEPGDRVQEHVRISAVQVCARQEVRADHLQAVTPGFISSKHESRRFQRLLHDRNLALVQLEIDDLHGSCIQLLNRDFLADRFEISI